jgi:cytochrome c
MDTMTGTKVLGGFCGALLIYLLGNWAAEELYHVGGSHGSDHAAGYAIEVAEAEVEAEIWRMRGRNLLSFIWRQI